MLDITEYVNTTSFNNDVFTFLSTENTSERHLIGYSPGKITTWNYGVYSPHSPENMSLLIHEVAHVVEMYTRIPNRILEKNYGYKSNAKLNHTGTLIECNVIAIQKIIEYAYPKVFDNTPMHNIWNALQYFRNMKISFGEFCEIVERSKQKYSIEYIENIWKDACMFVKQNYQ